MERLYTSSATVRRVLQIYYPAAWQLVFCSLKKLLTPVFRLRAGTCVFHLNGHRRETKALTPCRALNTLRRIRGL
jgi:hypothetical protein